ncbi:hypothetical protein RFI_23886 [Reticulomyxa filosa]|uniref:Non-structural maintenance of chromosomes element 4 n=1 Tax=Reticulomyxa filosa TaxID=46433 RepID=X6MHK4_RETFI|nr:hypothetical protein RFI_23886 [Reticulomyxa filosa]|eukprot:ETO13488.1 hypothetical protein RFI_23886 [Reticulomyxa filosa]
MEKTSEYIKNQKKKKWIVLKKFRVNNENNENTENENVNENEKMVLDWDALGDAFAPYWYTVPPISFLLRFFCYHFICWRIYIYIYIYVYFMHKYINWPKIWNKKKQLDSQKTRVEESNGARNTAYSNQKRGARRSNGNKKRIEKLRQVVRRLTDTNPNHEFDLFKLVANPSSFGETVENLFDLSFLVKEGEVQININEDTKKPFGVNRCLLLLSSSVYVPAQDFKDKQKSIKNGQCIIKMDMRMCKGIVDKYKIQSSQIKRDGKSTHENANTNHSSQRSQDSVFYEEFSTETEDN